MPVVLLVLEELAGDEGDGLLEAAGLLL